MRCVECGRVSRENERGWTGRLTVGDEVAIYCPECDRQVLRWQRVSIDGSVEAPAYVFSAAVALIFVGVAGSTPGQEASSIVVRGDVQIGRFYVKRDGTLDGAIRAFGKPTSLRRGQYQDCTALWRPIGLRISFYNLGGRNPCLRQYGYFSHATMVGSHWITARGLRLGEPARKLYVLYSPRRFSGSWAWLLTRWSPYGDGAYYAGLAGKIHDGRVTAFRIRYAAGGD